jgi:hypothetical protein
MGPFRLGRIVLAGMVVAAACRESTGPGMTVVPGAITWIEWPAAVSLGQVASVRVSSIEWCGYQTVYGVAVRGTEVHVTAEARARSDMVCLQGGGSGAGFDTVLALPQLGTGGSGSFVPYMLWAPVPGPAYGGFGRPTERMLGYVEAGGTDTSTHFAGIVSLALDSLGCWRAQPLSAPPIPRWAFARPLALAPASAGRRAFLVGRFVAESPAACGDARAIAPLTLEVDATP